MSAGNSQGGASGAAEQVPAANACGKFTCDVGTVTDSTMMLTWQRNLPSAYSGCSGAADDPCTWEEAKRYCGQLSLDGGGWRLPTLDELNTILDKTMPSPMIDSKAFPNTPPEYFWTSITYPPALPWAMPTGALINFDTGVGAVSNLTGFGFVRCVR